MFTNRIAGHHSEDKNAGRSEQARKPAPPGFSALPAGPVSSNPGPLDASALYRQAYEAAKAAADARLLALLRSRQGLSLN